MTNAALTRWRTFVLTQTKSSASPSRITRRQRAGGWALLIAVLLLFVAPPLVELLDAPDTLVSALLRHSELMVPFALLAAEEAGIPLPVPGDVVIAYVGYQAATGAIPYPLAFVALLVAVLGGSSILYFLSCRWGQAVVTRLGKFMHLSEERLSWAERRFQSQGAWFIVFGRHIPGLRVPITVFCGVSRVCYRFFLASTMVSVVFWIAFWLVVGSRLGPGTVHLLHDTHWYLILVPPGVVFGAVLLVRILARLRSNEG